MKTIEEKLQICRECKNRIEYHSRLTCKVTSDDPKFEDECPNYDPDDKEIIKNKRRQENEEANKTKVRGWLAFFLWIGICGGVLLTIGTAILESDNIIYSLVGLLPQTPIFIIAVMTIIAFYKRKNNAVALAYTYISMIVLSGVYLIILLGMANDSIPASEMVDHFMTVARTFAWGICWGLFIKTSVRVKNVIPEETRKWGIPEKILLIIYILLLGGSIWLTSQGAQQMSAESEDSIESMIEQLSSENLPMEVSEGIVLETVGKEYDRLVLSYSMTEISRDEVSEDMLDAYFSQLKYSLLDVLYRHPETERLVVASLKKGDNVLYTYSDKNDEALGNVLITSGDYRRVVDNKGENIVEKIELLGLLDGYNKNIPCEYFGGTELCAVDLNYMDKVITYTVKLPELSVDEMSSVTQSYLNDYVLENWSEIEDSMITLAKINRMDIVFAFKSHYSGKDYAEVRITPEQYLQQ